MYNFLVSFSSFLRLIVHHKFVLKFHKYRNPIVCASDTNYLQYNSLYLTYSPLLTNIFCDDKCLLIHTTYTVVALQMNLFQKCMLSEQKQNLLLRLLLDFYLNKLFSFLFYAVFVKCANSFRRVAIFFVDVSFLVVVSAIASFVLPAFCLLRFKRQSFTSLCRCIFGGNCSNYFIDFDKFSLIPFFLNERKIYLTTQISDFLRRW